MREEQIMLVALGTMTSGDPGGGRAGPFYSLGLSITRVSSPNFLYVFSALYRAVSGKRSKQVNSETSKYSG